MGEILAATFLTFAIAYADINVYEEPQQFISPVPKYNIEEPADPRIEKIQTYLEKHNSPIADHAKLIVDVSYIYGLDPYFLVSISAVESTFCKHIPSDSYNCFGWGIYGNKITRFNSYAEGIETVARGLNTERYREKTIEEIAEIYCTGPENWSSNVRWFINEIKSK